MKTIKLLLCLIILFSGIELSAQNISQSQARQILTSAYSEFSKAVPEKDINTIMKYYDDEVTYLPMSGVILQGKMEAKKAWEKTFTFPVVKFEQEIISLEVQGNFIFEVGRTHSKFSMNGQETPGEFKYFNVWKRGADDMFKIYKAAYSQWTTNN